MNRLFCILLSLRLITAASFCSAEDAPAAVVETQAEETSEPVLLVTVNGDEIYTDDTYLNNVIAYYMDYASYNGYDTSSEDLVAMINQYSLVYAIRTSLVRQKAAELGMNQFTDEDKAAMKETAVSEWGDIIDSYIADSGVISNDSTDDEKAAARADAEAALLAYGYDEAKYVEEYMQNAIENKMMERLEDYLTDNKAVTDEEVLAYFNDLVNDDKETFENEYENSVAAYEFYTQYYGQSSYYIPEGYRAVTHILLPVDEELMNTWKDLNARLEEQKSNEEAESTETEEPSETEGTPAPDAESAAEPEPAPEPVTQEMVDAAEQAILDSVQSSVDEIMAKLESGVSFDDLIKEYGTDPGMQNDATRAEGYAVHQDSILWDSAFTEGAMALEKVGDVGKPIVSQFGVHILQSLRDIPGGAAELTDEMKEEFRATMLSEIRNEALNTAIDQWYEDAEIVYTEAGESWKVPAGEADTAEEAAAAD